MYKLGFTLGSSDQFLRMLTVHLIIMQLVLGHPNSKGVHILGVEFYIQAQVSEIRAAENECPSEL